MLKSNASARAQRDHISSLKDSNRNSLYLTSPKPINNNNNSNNSTKKSSNNQKDSSASKNGAGVNDDAAKLSYFKKYHVIDADSISLASLSESPPSEFKFSDEEEEKNDEEETVRVIRQNSLLLNKKQQQVNELKMRKSSTLNLKHDIEQMKLQRGESPSACANVSEHIGSNASATSQIKEINKSLERQRILQNQLNQIKTAKKNFHAVLLKDPKCKFILQQRSLILEIDFSKKISSLFFQPNSVK